MKRIFLIILILTSVHCAFAYDLRALGDSLENYTGFNLGCVPKIKVTQVKSNGDQLYVYTNKVLSCLSLSPKQINQLRLKISLWLLGHRNGKVSIYSDGFELNELLTARYKQRPASDHYPIPNKIELGEALGGQHIALWPSHGVYYNRDEDRWRLQRATMWTTVEDLYTTTYAEQVSQMLERAGATVYWPRARYGHDRAATETGPSGYPRWAEAARYWLEYISVPDTIWNPVTDKNDPLKDSVRNDYLDDLRCRGLWVNWLSGGSHTNPNQPGRGVPISVCLALHTDGFSQPGDSISIGTLAIYSRQDNNHQTTFPTGTDRIINRDLADYVQTQIVEDVQRKYDPNWKRRQLHNASYCESRYPVVPTVLLEILSHKQFADIRLGLEPAFRKDVARAIYKGVGRWIHAQTGTDFVVQPLPVERMAVKLNKDDFVVTWTAAIDSLEPTATPDYYLIELRENDGAWQSAVRVKAPKYSFRAREGVRYDIRVTAGNAGGTSEVSETLSAYRGDKNKPTILIVNAFNHASGPQWIADSLNAGIAPFSAATPDGEDGIYIGEMWEYNRALDWVTDDDCGWGMCYRDQTGTRQVGNTRNYPVLHGRVLQKLGYSFVSANADALDSVTGDFGLVDIILGKDSKEVLSRLTTDKPTLVSGAYLGTVPRATRIGSVLFLGKLYRLSITPNTERLCCPDATGFIPAKNERVPARFLDSGVPACVQQDRKLQWSFPLEACETFEELYRNSIETLLR